MSDTPGAIEKECHSYPAEGKLPGGRLHLKFACVLKSVFSFYNNIVIYKY